MTHLDARLVALALRLYPTAFRSRFGDEMLSVYLDQRDAIVADPRRAPFALEKHAARSLFGVLRNVVTVRRDAHRRVARVQDSHREPTSGMGTIVTDARHALRLLRTNPGFALVAILTLALGIGANTAVFSVLNSVILAPLPYDQPEQLVRLYSTRTDAPGERQFHTGLDILDVRREVRAFASLGIFYTYREIGGDLEVSGGAPQRIRVLPVSADYFRTLRATPLLGRPFTQDEERYDARRIVLSHALWSSLTGRDPSAIGRTIAFNGQSYEIIGVMRPTFSDVIAGDVAAWIPHDLQNAQRHRLAMVPGSNNRYNSYLSAIARLAPGVSVEAAQAELDALMRRLGEAYPNTNATRTMRVMPLHQDIVGESTSAVYILMGAAGLVLLIACLNVANLFLARGVTQARDTAIRTALGAKRSRLVRQRLTESLIVAIVGGVVGSVVAYWGVKVLLAVSPESLVRAEAVRFDPTLLGFSIALTLLTGVLFGAGPAFRGSRADPTATLRDGARGNTSGRASRRARNALVASQVAVALVLLVGAGVLIRSFVATQRLDLGLDPTNVATFEVNLPPIRYDSAERRVQFHRMYQERLRAISGVQKVGATSWLPTNGEYHVWGFEYTDAAGQPQSLGGNVRVIDGDFFEAFHVPLVQGRTFTTADRLDTDIVALISRSMARRAFGAGDPIGQRVRTGGMDVTVVGVVGDVATAAKGATASTVYLSHGQAATNRNWALTYVVRTSVPPASILETARRELASIDPSLVLYQPRTMEGVLARHLARDRFVLLLMVTFGGVALSLAAVGVYGVLSYLVTQRVHEIGVRLALGARPAQVRASVLLQGLRVAGIGVVLGLAGAFSLSGVLQSLGIAGRARDPVVFILATVVLSVVVLAAGFVPARRATRVDPLEALRSE
jgi:putative ABC transport system permease protein